MGYPVYGGHIDEVLKGADSVAIIRNMEYSYRVGRTEQDLITQLKALDKYHKVERVYHGLNFKVILPRLEAAVLEANTINRVPGVRRAHLKVDFTRRLTKASS